MPRTDEERAKHAKYMRAYYNDPAHPERRKKKRKADRERNRANPEPARQRALDWYYQNTETVAARNKRIREEIKAIALEAKQVPCMDCGQSFPPVVMQFHHRDPTTKKGEVCNRSTIKAALEELAKCDVICANCHCLRHGEEE